MKKPDFDNWIADIKAMTCRNKNNNMVVAMKPYEGLFLCKIIKMPEEWRKILTKEPNGKEQIRNLVYEAGEVFYWKYNDKKIKAYKRRTQKELEIIKANVGKMRFEDYWKNELIKTAELILKIYGKKVSNKQIFNLEKSIKACISHIRQYKDFYCNTKRNYPQKIDVSYYNVKDSRVKQYIFSGHYDMRNIKFKKINLNYLFGNLINISMYPYYVTDNIVLGVLFYSDNEANDILVKFELFEFAAILFSLAKDENVKLEPEFDEKGKLTHFIFS